MAALKELVHHMTKGRAATGKGKNEEVRELLWKVYNERCHSAGHHKRQYQVRVNLQGGEQEANYAGFITAENPTSGPYQGTSFVWFPGGGKPGRPRRRDRRSGLGSSHPRSSRTPTPPACPFEAARPGNLGETGPTRPNLEDPNRASQGLAEVDAALKAYEKVVYAAVPIRGEADEEAVADLIDLFFFEHDTPLTGKPGKRWEDRLRDISGAVFPQVTSKDVLSILEERRFVVLEGPPGTGKTRLAFQIADAIGSSTRLQFHAARTYEDFVVGLFPRVAESGIAFEVKAGDLLRANAEAGEKNHLLLIDEINRADLARVLGEAIVLFEPGETGRSVRLPHVPPDHANTLTLSPNLMVLGTRNTADRTIARLDLAIRRRFAFVPMWPDLEPVRKEGVELAKDMFAEVTNTFVENADEDTFRLVPGHSYFLDPRPDLEVESRAQRVARRLEYELLPLLRSYLEERLLGEASEAVLGLIELLEASVAETE